MILTKVLFFVKRLGKLAGGDPHGLALQDHFQRVKYFTSSGTSDSRKLPKLFQETAFLPFYSQTMFINVDSGETISEENKLMVFANLYGNLWIGRQRRGGGEEWFMKILD